MAGTSWGFHPFSLLLILNEVMKSVADYGLFLYASVSSTHCRKLNSFIPSYLRIAIGTIRTTPLASLEMECFRSSTKIRSRHLTGKFLLKIMSSPLFSLYQSFVTINGIKWYVLKLFPSWPYFFIIYPLHINYFSF